jgi:hypothetical protein
MDIYFKLHNFQGYEYFSSYVFNEESLINCFFTISGIYLSLQLIPAIKNSQVKVWRQVWNFFNKRQEQNFSLVALNLLIVLTIFPHLSEGKKEFN